MAAARRAAFGAGLGLAAALLAAVARPAEGADYSVEELRNAHHSIGMKLAVEEDDTEVMKGLLKVYLEEQKVDLEELCNSHSNIFHYADYTPIHYAALLNRVEHIRILVEAGCSVDKETDRGIPPLHAAAKDGSSASARVLLEHGADPKKIAIEKMLNNNDVPQKGFNYMNAATMAAKGGHVDILRTFHEFGGGAKESLQERDLNGKMSENGWAPIHYAANKGHRDAFRFLTFEVGWGEKSLKAEVVEAAHDSHRSEIESLALLDGSSPEFAAAREKYRAEVLTSLSRETEL